MFFYDALGPFSDPHGEFGVSSSAWAELQDRSARRAVSAGHGLTAPCALGIGTAASSRVADCVQTHRRVQCSCLLPEEDARAVVASC